MTSSIVPRDEENTAAKVISDRILAMVAAGKLGTPEGLGEYQDGPLGDYITAMAEQATAEADVAKWSDRRAYALHRLHTEGWSYQRISDAVGLSRARVQQLVQRGQQVEEAD